MRYWEIIADNLGKTDGAWTTFQPWLRAANSLRCLRSRTAARRSSIKSRSTSQYLSDEKSSEGVWSTSVVSSLVIISGRDLPDNLAELRRLRLDFAFRDRVRFVRPAPMNSPQGFNITMGRAVVRNRRNIRLKSMPHESNYGSTLSGLTLSSRTLTPSRTQSAVRLCPKYSSRTF